MVGTGRIAIVGAGPAGASLALLLARCRVPVTLLEKETSLERVFRGEGLMPAGMDALLQMHLGSLLQQIPSRQLQSWHIYLGGKAVFKIPEPVDRLGERALSIVSQPALLEGILAEAETFPEFELRMGSQVKELRWQGDRVVGLTFEHQGQTSELATDLVVGCDGRGSLVRRRAGLDIRLQPDQYDVLWFKLPAPEQLRHTCQFYLMAKFQQHPASCYTSWDGQLQYGLILPKGGLSRLDGVDWLELAARPAPDWLADHLLTQRHRVSEPVPLNVVVGHCQQWSIPGVLLLGDAAHPMSPVRAQGINLALRDAIVAANYLVPALKQGTGITDQTLQAIQNERLPEVLRSQALQRREASSLKLLRASPWKFSLAQRLLPIVGQIPIAQQAWLARQRHLRFGSQPVQLQVAQPPSADSPQFLPQ